MQLSELPLLQRSPWGDQESCFQGMVIFKFVYVFSELIDDFKRVRLLLILEEGANGIRIS